VTLVIPFGMPLMHIMVLKNSLLNYLSFSVEKILFLQINFISLLNAFSKISLLLSQLHL